MLADEPAVEAVRTEFVGEVARRLRSAFATFAPLLEAEESTALREELKWIASELGGIRDTEVMIERLDRHAGARALGLRAARRQLGPVGARVDRQHHVERDVSDHDVGDLKA